MAALECYRESLKLHSTIGDPNGEALTRQVLGQLQRSLGNYDEAQRQLQQALQIQRSIGDRRAEVQTLYQVGFLHCRLAEFEAATAHLEEALTGLREEFIDPWALRQAYYYYSWSLIEMDRLAEAQNHLQEAMKTESGLHQPATLIEGAVQLARIALARDDLSLASACAHPILEFLDQQGTVGLEHPGLAYLTGYRICRATQEFSQAEKVLNQARRFLKHQADQIGDPQLRQSYLNLPEHRELQALATE
jgi:tetratricopeptide (TPR) repeat protein